MLKGKTIDENASKCKSYKIKVINTYFLELLLSIVTKENYITCQRIRLFFPS